MDAQTFESLVTSLMGPQQAQQPSPLQQQPAPGNTQALASAMTGQPGGQGEPPTLQEPTQIAAPRPFESIANTAPQPPPSSGPGEITGLGQGQLAATSDIPHHTTGIGQGINNLGAGAGHAIGTIARMIAGSGGGGMGGMGGGMGSMMGMFSKFGGGGG